MNAYIQRWVFVIAAASFLASVGYAFFYRIEPVVDADAYDAIAVNLLEGFGFRESRTAPLAFDTAIIRAGPAYEFFLAGLYAAFGHRPEAVWIAQAVIHALSALFLFFIARRVFPGEGAVIGTIAAAFFGLHPDLIEISAMLMTETLYLFLTILAVWCFVRAYEAPRSVLFAGALGIALGVAVLARPPVLFFIPVALVFYASRRCYRSAIVFALVFAGALAPWTARNYHAYGQFISTTLIGEYNLWVGNTLQSSGGQISGGFNPATTYGAAEGYAGFKDAARMAFRGFVVEHPFHFVKLAGLRVVRYFSLIRPMGFWFYQHGITQAFFVTSSLMAIALLFVLGFSGMARAWRERNALWRYLVVLALSAPLSLLPAVVESRYRFQIYPLLALFAGYAVARIMAERRILPTVRVAAPLLLGASIIDALLFFPTILAHVRVFFDT